MRWIRRLSMHSRNLTTSFTTMQANRSTCKETLERHLPSRTQQNRLQNAAVARANEQLINPYVSSSVWLFIREKGTQEVAHWTVLLFCYELRTETGWGPAWYWCVETHPSISEPVAESGFVLNADVIHTGSNNIFGCSMDRQNIIAFCSSLKMLTTEMRHSIASSVSLLNWISFTIRNFLNNLIDKFHHDSNHNNYHSFRRWNRSQSSRVEKLLRTNG